MQSTDKVKNGPLNTNLDINYCAHDAFLKEYSSGKKLGIQIK